MGQTLPFHDFFPGEESYWVKFADDEQEKALLPLIRKDPGVTRIFPNRKSDSGRAPVEPILRIGAHQVSCHHVHILWQSLIRVGTVSEVMTSIHMQLWVVE